MKKRRTTIIAVLLIAALALGIGYAALSDDLQITGSAAITATEADEAFEADVYFSKAVMTADRGTAVIGELATGTDDADKITITVAAGALKGKGDSVICAAEISNKGDIDAIVTLGTPAITGDSEYFAVTTSWAGNTAQVNQGGTADLTITITCTKTPTEAVDMAFTLDLTADAVVTLP